jgi:hypothetical protein
MILSFHCAHDLAQGLRGGHCEPWDADSPLDTTRWELRHTSSEETQACGERERDRCTTGWVAKRWGIVASPRFASSSEGEVERGATLPPIRMTPSPNWEMFPCRRGLRLVNPD